MGGWLSSIIFRFFKDLLAFSVQRQGPWSYPSPASSHAEGDVAPVFMWGDAGQGAAGFAWHLSEVFVSYESVSHPSFLFNTSWQRVSSALV